MPIQLADAHRDQISAIMAKTSVTLTDAHMAYAKGFLTEEHFADAIRARDNMISLLADFEDGQYYGAIEPEWCRTMRHFETAASALISAVQFEDDVRPAMQAVA